ncbi:MAG: hypothetical protein CSB55_06670 [Candidatus Cloacimonadota bacterium]|nr:MAG: hypothetical protein CSB55_06670 [Candidatus Cloacimonadota bacterium]
MAILRKWYININSTDSDKKFSLSFSKNFLTGALIAFLFILSAFGMFFVNLMQKHVDATELEKIKEENIALRSRLLQLDNKLDKIMIDIKLLELLENSIRAEKNLKQINEEIRALGTGGMPIIDSSLVKYGLDLSNRYNEAIRKINHLQNKIEFDTESCKNLAENIALQEEIYRATPSIYPAFGRISDKFGWRRHPVTGKRSFHRGLDIANERGTPIYASADGVVKATGRKKLFGKYITIEHGYGYATKYAHLHKFLVKKGDKVKKGQIIGQMGNTGRSTGDHLHYEVIYYGRKINPYRYLNKFESDIDVAGH